VVSYGTAAPDVDLAQAREDFFGAFPKLRDKQLLLFLGRLHEKKGCDLIIESLATIPDPMIRLVIAGPCADENYLARLHALAAHTADRTMFAGMLRGNLKWGAFAAAEAFVMPSHQENFGIAVAGALACGTPVLISNKVNIWREIVNDGAGFADEDDRAGVTRLIERWMGASAAEREAMRSNARRCFERRFQIDGAIDSLLRVLAEPRKTP